MASPPDAAVRRAPASRARHAGGLAAVEKRPASPRRRAGLLAKLLLGVLVLALLGGAGFVYANLSGKLADARERAEELEAANGVLGDEKAQLEENVSEIEQERAAAQKRGNDLEARVSSCRAVFRRSVELGLSGLTPTEAEAFSLTRDIVECFEGFPEFLGPAPEDLPAV